MFYLIYQHINRDGQNVIKDSGTGTIVYMPPESKAVAGFMRNLVSWIKENDELPCPIIAGIAHYQFATIHLIMMGNGRTARLLTTLILHLGGYDLKGLYSLEEYYAKNLLGLEQLALGLLTITILGVLKVILPIG